MNSTDTINITAEFDKYGTHMISFMEPVKEPTFELLKLAGRLTLEQCKKMEISGSSEYALVVADLVIEGKAVLACQQAVIQTGDAYMTTMVQSLASQRQTGRLQAAIDNVVADEKVLAIFKNAMLERVVSSRAWIALDYRDYVSAYMWYSLASSTPIDCSNPVKPVAELVNDASTLQAAVAQAEEHVCSQTRLFRFSSQANGFLGTDWKQRLLSSTRTVVFSFDVRDAVFARFSRIRINRFR